MQEGQWKVQSKDTESRDKTVAMHWRTADESVEYDGAVEESLDWKLVLKLLGVNLCLAEENFQI